MFRENLIAVLKSHYHHALASVKVVEEENKYSARRQGTEQRSRYLRETIDRIEQAGREMASQLPTSPA